MEQLECKRCILSRTDYPNISFNFEGVCDICLSFDIIRRDSVPHPDLAPLKLTELLDKVRNSGRGKSYDCIIGVSGGVDSTYLCYLAKSWNLRPLLLHVDNGWNTELAVNNIECIVDKCDFDLHTKVLDWNQLRDIQRSFIKSHVMDIDLPFDNAFVSVLFNVAFKHNIKFILSGHNVVTEGILPPNFTHWKLDSLNIRSIHKQFGEFKINSFPIIGPLKYFLFTKLLGIQFVSPLNYCEYSRDMAKTVITKELGWRDYGGKHYENIFTRFYQGKILVDKFGIDKRKAHLSNLIQSGQLTRDAALNEFLSSSPYSDQNLLGTDFNFFAKKLGFDKKYLEDYMNVQGLSNTEYPSWVNIMNKFRPFYHKMRNLISV